MVASPRAAAALSLALDQKDGSTAIVAAGLPGDAFAVLGPHVQADGRLRVRVLAPGAEAFRRAGQGAGQGHAPAGIA